MDISMLSKYIKKKINPILPILPTSRYELDLYTKTSTINTNSLDKFSIHIKPTFSDQEIKLMEEGKSKKISNLKQCVSYP